MSYTSDALTLIQDGRKFTKADLAAGIQCSHDQVRTLVQNLTKTGRIEILARDVGDAKRTVYAITPAGVAFLEQGMCRNRPRKKARVMRMLNSVWALGACA